MLSNLKSALLISSFALFSLSAFAEKSELFSVNGTIDARIPLKIKNNNINSNYDVDALNGFKNIKLIFNFQLHNVLLFFLLSDIIYRW